MVDHGVGAAIVLDSTLFFNERIRLAALAAKSQNVGSLAPIVGLPLSLLARNVSRKRLLFAGPGAAVCRPLQVAVLIAHPDPSPPADSFGCSQR
jgi:hypothetical protein